MSKVLDVLKSIPSAIKRYDEDLPQSNATPGFTGKGLLTALIDTTGSELARRRAMEDEIRNGTGKFLIDNFWKAISLGDPTETARYQDQLLNIYGHDKHIKKWMTEELFPRAEQMRQGIQMFKGAPEGVQPQAPDYGSGGPQQQQQPQQGGPDPELANIYSGLGSILPPPPKPTPTPIPAAGGLLNPPPQAQAQVPVPTTDTRPAFPPQSVEVSKPPLPPAPKFAPPPAPTSPLQSILRKISPTPLTEQQKLEFAEESKQYGAGMSHLNTLETDEAKHRQAMELMQAQIDAGRFDKTVKANKTWMVPDEMIDGKKYRVVYSTDANGRVVNREVLGEAGTTSSSPSVLGAQSIMMEPGNEDMNLMQAMQEYYRRTSYGRAQGTAAINGVPLTTGIVNGTPTNLPRPEAAHTAAPATVFNMQGVPSVGGVQGISLTPPPTVPATTQEQIANLRTSINLLDSNVIPSIKKNADVLGPVMGRIKLGEVALGGYGLTQPQIQMVLDLQRLMTSEAFANGGKQLTSTELGQFEKLLPKPTDTLQTALTKAKSARDFLDARLQSRLGVMPARERAQIPGEGGAATGGAGTDMVKITKDGKAFKVPRANLKQALERGYKESK